MGSRFCGIIDYMRFFGLIGLVTALAFGFYLAMKNPALAPAAPETATESSGLSVLNDAKQAAKQLEGSARAENE